MIRATSIIWLLFLFSASFYTYNANAQMDSTASRASVRKDSGIVFLVDGVPLTSGTALHCEEYKRVVMRVYLPRDFTEKFDKLKFFLSIDGAEFKSKDIMKSEFTKITAAGNIWEGLMVSDDSHHITDFDNTSTSYLSNEEVCFKQIGKENKKYIINALAKGYIKTGENKKGNPVYMNQVELSKTEIILEAEHALK